MPAIVLPSGYGYVLAAASSSLYLNLWQIMKVSSARKRSGIKYPQLYADKAEAEANKEAYVFNCVQRAHQNTLEQLPHTLLSILVTGLKHPQLAAGLGGAWFVGRVLYTIGYSTGEPSKRNSTSLFLPSLTTLAMLFTTGYTVYEFIAEGL